MNDVSDQTKVEMFIQVVGENNCSPNTISICYRIRDERKLHKEDLVRMSNKLNKILVRMTKFTYF